MTQLSDRCHLRQVTEHHTPLPAPLHYGQQERGVAGGRTGSSASNGVIAEREDHRLAAARELREEVGITINPDALR